MKVWKFLLLVLLVGVVCPNARGQHFVYNNGQDSICFAPISTKPFSYCNVCTVVDSMQIDGVGAKELVFHRTCAAQISEHGGMFDIVEDIQLSRFEIWNLDTKTCLFQIDDHYHNVFSRSDGRFDAPWPARGAGVERRSCNFSIDSLGIVTISNYSHTFQKREGQEDNFGKWQEVLVPVDDLSQAPVPDRVYFFSKEEGKYIPAKD